MIVCKFAEYLNELVDIDKFKFISHQWGDVKESEEAKTFIKKYFPLYDDGDDLYVTYRYNNKLVAVCVFDYCDTDTYDIEENYIHISYIYTEIKNEGIASSMINCIFNGYPDINLFACYIRKSNIPSLNMFKKIGFEIIGEIKLDKLNEESYELSFRKNSKK